MIFMLFSTLIRPCLAADLLDPKEFSKTLSKLATDGLGTDTLQVINRVVARRCSCYLVNKYSRTSANFDSLMDFWSKPKIRVRQLKGVVLLF